MVPWGIDGSGQMLNQALLSQQTRLREAMYSLGYFEKNATIVDIAIEGELRHDVRGGINLQFTFLYSCLGRGVLR